MCYFMINVLSLDSRQKSLNKKVISKILKIVHFFSGDSFTNHNGAQFYTKDRDNSISCALNSKGGWWYTRCHQCNLNGMYLSGNHPSYADGINWKAWHGYHYSLKTTEMKIRRLWNILSHKNITKTMVKWFMNVL